MCTNMGGSGGNGGSSNNPSFPKISLQGKTGTEKQRQYAEDLIESTRLTAEYNGIAGVIKEEGGKKRYVSKDTAESVRAAYTLFYESANTRKTYGEVIDLFKSKSILSLADDLKAGANKAGKNVIEYVNDFIREAKKKRR